MSVQFVNERGLRVACSCGRRTIRFGNGMDRDQARNIADAFAARIEPKGEETGATLSFGHCGSRWLIVFIFAWVLCMAGGFTFAWRNDSPHGLGLVGWAAIGQFIAWMGIGFLLAPFERHFAFVSPIELEIRRAVGPAGWTRRYERTQIEDLRAVPVETEDGPSEDDFELAFRFGGKSVRFGMGLTRAEAEAAADVLAERLRFA